MAEEFFDDSVYTLTDENGNDEDFVLLGSAEIEGKVYLALVPAAQADSENAEYVILRIRTKTEKIFSLQSTMMKSLIPLPTFSRMSFSARSTTMEKISNTYAY